MRSAWILVALAAGAVIGSATAAPRAGKVVRVERKSASATGHPRYCQLQSSDMFGSCAGTKAPEIGDRMVVVDRNRVIGMVRVTTVQPYADGCQQTYTWMIQTVVESGDFSNTRSIVLALADVNVDMRSARLIDVDRSPTGHPWGTDQIFALDNNGDDNPDLEFIEYACDDAGLAATSTATSRCQDVWAMHSNKKLERIRHERFRNCY